MVFRNTWVLWPHLLLWLQGVFLTQARDTKKYQGTKTNVTTQEAYGATTVSLPVSSEAALLSGERKLASSSDDFSQVLPLADIDGSTGISTVELDIFLSVVLGRTPPSLEASADLYTRFDLDGNGVIDSLEFIEVGNFMSLTVDSVLESYKTYASTVQNKIWAVYGSLVSSACVDPEPDSTPEPTFSPSPNQGTGPTEDPTPLPTQQPTAFPTSFPTSMPTKKPTSPPSDFPTTMPSMKPTFFPTQSPTLVPSEGPTLPPTDNPTDNPTSSPTRYPSFTPTKDPTKSPTDLPTRSPTNLPTSSPIKKDTKEPTPVPTLSPTKRPTQVPTPAPTKAPTPLPTNLPTVSPTTALPTKSPSLAPTSRPTTLLCNSGWELKAGMCLKTFGGRSFQVCKDLCAANEAKLPCYHNYEQAEAVRSVPYMNYYWVGQMDANQNFVWGNDSCESTYRVFRNGLPPANSCLDDWYGWSNWPCGSSSNCVCQQDPEVLY